MAEACYLPGRVASLRDLHYVSRRLKSQ